MKMVAPIAWQFTSDGTLEINGEICAIRVICGPENNKAKCWQQGILAGFYSRNRTILSSWSNIL
jgi:hypothetical protein